jgi:hypothetical protein
MRPLERITILIEPYEPGLLYDQVPNPARRVFWEYDRFAAELQQHTTARVEIVERWLKDAPRDGMLLIDHHIASAEALLADASAATPDVARPILLNMSRSVAYSRAEALRPAGFVLNDRFGRWHARQDHRIRHQIYGLKSLAPALAPTLELDSLGETEHYCTYTTAVRDQVLQLSEILARYIDAYWRSLPQ